MWGRQQHTFGESSDSTGGVMSSYPGKRLLPLLLSALILSLLLPCAFAQETTAGLQGTVKDPTGAVVAKAMVEVTSPALIGVKKLETDASGYRSEERRVGKEGRVRGCADA